jgi:hypothetical protein
MRAPSFSSPKVWLNAVLFLAGSGALGCDGSVGTTGGPGKTGGESAGVGGAVGGGNTDGAGPGANGGTSANGGASAAGGAAGVGTNAGGSAGIAGVGGSVGGGGSVGVGGSGIPDAGVPPAPDASTAACSSSLASRVRITEIDVGAMVAYNEVDNNGAALGLTPLAISPLPGGGSRVAFLGKGDSTVHVVTLDANDQLVAGSTFGLPGFDFQDIYADATGGVLLVSRAALGSTLNNNCGNINNLCGLVANYPTAASCYDMYMVRFDGSTETWATKLTDTTAQLPGYSTSASMGAQVVFIWSEYAHNARIAFDGSNYAAYFGVAITVPNQSCCTQDMPAPCRAISALDMGVNIHQGDRMKVVSSSGALQTGGFGIGCSHSGFERVIWDPAASKFVGVCKNDLPVAGKSGRIAFPSPTTTIVPVDLFYSNLGNIVTASGGGYWIINSDIRSGQPANANGLADVHLLHVASTATPVPNNDIILASDAQNDRAPHLAAYGRTQLLTAWETSTATGDLAQNAANRQMFIRIVDSTTGAAPAGSTADTAGPLRLTPNVLGSRYQDFRAFPDGSAAYPAPGSAATKIKILRVMGCNG